MSHDSHEKLLAGFRRFRRDIYPEKEAIYKRVAQEGQRPHALFITCADSRIDPELITQSGPGDIFVSRNIGNIVPPYGEVWGGVSAIIEYAVSALQVNQVVICGHSDCGAMIGLLHPEKVANLPVVRSWLRNGKAALGAVRDHDNAGAETAVLEELTQENVILQLQNLRTHPSVAERLAEGTLTIAGWVFDIAHGNIQVYDEDHRKFSPIHHEPESDGKATA